MSGLGRTLAVGLLGTQGHVVGVEASVTAGLPSFTVGGLGDSAVAQAQGRVRSAGSGVGLPVGQRSVTLNLSPAWMRKEGSSYDLAIFIACAMALGRCDGRVAGEVVHIGELGLDGSVRSVRGVLPAVLAAVAAGHQQVVVPVENAREAMLVPGVAVHPVHHVAELLQHYACLAKGRPPLPVALPEAAGPPDDAPVGDLSEVLGQLEAKAALELAAAGGHHLLLSGPPGAGKTMLSERLPSVLPELDDEQAMEVTAIHSLLGALGDSPRLVRRPPFVAPHHGASTAAIIGGGTPRVRPGAVTLAHHGVLFLDEAAEFAKNVLQSLRTPLERGSVTVSRASETVTFPSRFQLVLAVNPCPCGNGWGKARDCTCSPLARRAYLGKLNGPLLDRVDLQVHVTPPGLALSTAQPGEPSQVVAARVRQAREVQRLRWSAVGVTVNAAVPGSVLRSPALRPSRAASASIDRALELGSLSLRGYDRCLRVAWTSADLDGALLPSAEHIDLALSFRRRMASAA